MRVLLVHPPTNFIQQSYGVQRKVNFGHAPPLALGYIASYLRQDGHDVSILDASALSIGLDEAARLVVSHGPDVVGLTVLTNYAEMANQLSEKIKAQMPDVRVVLGGAHATYFFQEILNAMPGVDHVIYGEADTVIRDYVRFIDDPRELRKLRGLVYRDQNGRVVVNPSADLVENLDDIPMPAWDLYDMSLYRPLPLQYRRLPFFTMITSRGCWWSRCKFCFQAGRCAVKYRRHSPERVVEELEILYHEYRIREVAFWDDTFIMNLSWLKRFKDLVDKKGLEISFVASGRANTMNEEMIRTIAEAGCWSMFVGIESGNQQLLDMIDKGITLEQARRIFRIAGKVGIETRAAFMLGLPGETPEMARQTVDFAIEIDPTYAIFYATHPRYGTQLYEIAAQTGQFLEQDFRGMSKVTYVPHGYTDRSQLERTIRMAYWKFYLRPRYILKTLLRIRKLSMLPELLKGFLLFLGLSRSG